MPDVFNYSINTSTYIDETNISHIVYGVDVVKINDSGAELVESIKNIFVHYSDAKRFVDMCNNGQLPLMHLRDVLENYLAII